VSGSSWLSPRLGYILFLVERTSAKQRGPARGLYLGLAVTILAVLAYGAYITIQFAGVRKLQSELVDRNRRDSLQLLRIQNDLNSIALAMRDMLDAGEPPLYIARRVVRMAIEDIGLADPQALMIANAAKDAYDFLGSPEGELAIAQAVLYVATAPKSNAAYKAYGAAMRTAKDAGSLLPPKHILNAPTRLMQEEGYGRGYAYDHDEAEAFSGQNYFPEALPRQQFYNPPERGFEREIRKRLEYWAKLRKERG